MSREDLLLNYAQAIYAMALEEWSAWLETVRGCLSEDEPLARFLADSEASPAEKQRRLEALIPAGASPKFRQLLGLLVDKGHLPMLNEIALSFERLAKRGPGAQVAYVSSAVELTPPERARMQETLRRRFGAGLELEFSVDPALYGGVRVRVGDIIIDGSVAGRLEALRGQLVSKK